MRGVTSQGREVRDTSYGARSRWRRAAVAVAQGRDGGGAGRGRSRGGAMAVAGRRWSQGKRRNGEGGRVTCERCG